MRPPSSAVAGQMYAILAAPHSRHLLSLAVIMTSGLTPFVLGALIHGQDGTKVFSGGCDKKVNIWDLGQNKIVNQFQVHTRPHNSAPKTCLGSSHSSLLPDLPGDKSK